jgi:hypothetical protein
MAPAFIVGSTGVNRFGGLMFREYRDAVEFSKLVSQPEMEAQ